MTKEKADRLAELLLKMVKLQWFIKGSSIAQRDEIFKKADEVIDEIVDNYDGDRTWCNALLTFGGQYFGQETKYWISDQMDVKTVQDALKREVYRRYGIEEEEVESEVSGSQDKYLELGAAGKLGDAQQSAYNFYHYDELHKK